MPRERVLKRSEFGKFLECHCYNVGSPQVGQVREKRYGGLDLYLHHYLAISQRKEG